LLNLTKGANTGLPSGLLRIRVVWSDLSAQIDDVDVTAFLLQADGKVAGDDGMVFYGHKASSDGAVVIETLSERGETCLGIDPSRLAGGITRIAITATLSGRAPRPFTDVGALDVHLDSPQGAVAQFSVTTADAKEAALILCEIYERGGAWKFRAVGQGFNGGLKPLAEHFGVDIAEPASRPPPAPPPAPPAASARPSVQPPPRTEKPISLSKVSLTKASPTVSLAKRPEGLGEIKVNLNWRRGEAKRGIFGGAAKGVDLDLCCLYELADGTRLGVQALGSNFGAYDRAPYILLDGDDRTGAKTDGEWLRLNGGKWNEIRRVLIWAMIYEGVPNWSATDGVVRLFAPGNPEIEVRLEGGGSERLCAIALLENNQGDLKITRESRYFGSAQEMDRHYGFNLNWTAGRK